MLQKGPTAHQTHCISFLPEPDPSVHTYPPIKDNPSLYLTVALPHDQKSGSMHSHLFHSSTPLYYAYDDPRSGKMRLSSTACSYRRQSFEARSYAPPAVPRNVSVLHVLEFYTGIDTDFLQKNF